MGSFWFIWEFACPTARVHTMQRNSGRRAFMLDSPDQRSLQDYVRQRGGAHVGAGRRRAIECSLTPGLADGDGEPLMCPENNASQSLKLEKKSALGEIWGFLKVRKKFWLAPIIIALLLLSALIVFAGSAGVVSPFIYAL